MNEQKVFESEQEKLNAAAKQTGDTIIDISERMSAEMQKWSDVSERPYELGPTECVGFINKTTSDGGLNLTIDLLTQKKTADATLRIWAITSEWDNDQNQRFNNIQMTFSAELPAAKEITVRGGDVTREDLRTIVYNKNTRLTRVVLSDKSGLDETERSLGRRYDLTVTASLDEFSARKGIAFDESGQTLSVNKVTDILQTILRTLEETAQRPI
jgi:hypothetical protein